MTGEFVYHPQVLVQATLASRLRRLLERRFYFLMALLIAMVVSYGFGQTIVGNLIKPAYPRPAILYVHAAVFIGWVVLFVTQTGLVAARNVKLHRRLGLFGIALGSVIPVLGVATAIVMARFRADHGDTGNMAFLDVSFFDLAAFAVSFALAAAWRRRPEYHRRLMLVGTCALTSAAFARFPFAAFQGNWWFVGVDALILLGVARDWIMMKWIHPVYLVSLPAMVVCQIAVVDLYLSNPPWWQALGWALIR